MNRMFPKLFERGRIGTLEVSNRIMKGPAGMSRGTADDTTLHFYGETARGGSGLVMVQVSRVDSRANEKLMVCHDSFIPGLASIAQVIQDNGAKAAIQYVHQETRNEGSRIVRKCASLEGPPERLAAIKRRPEVVYEEFTIEEILELIAAYGDAARRVQRAGFDLVEILAAHGHGINEFLSPRTNRRTDWYGGSLENRMRFLLEIVADVRRKVGRDYPLSVRLGWTEYYPGGIPLEEAVETARALEKAGVDVIHVTGGIGGGPLGYLMNAPMSVPVGSNTLGSEAVKKAVNIPVINSGSITTPEMAEEMLEKGQADYVGLVRALYADPYWPQKAKEGRPEDITPCIRCNSCSTVHPRPGAAEGVTFTCTVNVTFGKEARMPLIPAVRPKKVAVVGGGPGGMEAARVCALRGHKVTLYEKRELGGALMEASVPEFKSDLRRLTNYYITQLKKLKVEVVRQKATAATIKNGGFDAVIVAVGSVPLKPDIPGIDRPNVISAIDVLNNKKLPVGKKVLVAGGGMVAAEVGLWLAEQGKEVTFTFGRSLDEFMSDIHVYERLAYQQRFAKQKVTIKTGNHLDAVLEKGAVLIDSDGKKQEIQADSIVIAVGFATQTALRDQLEKVAGLDVYAVGDCVKPRDIFDAIHEGNSAARKI